MVQQSIKVQTQLQGISNLFIDIANTLLSYFGYIILTTSELLSQIPLVFCKPDNLKQVFKLSSIIVFIFSQVRITTKVGQELDVKQVLFIIIIIIIFILFVLLCWLIIPPCTKQLVHYSTNPISAVYIVTNILYKYIQQNSDFTLMLRNL